MVNKNYFDIFDVDDDTELPKDSKEVDKKAMHAVQGKVNFDLEWLFRPQNDQDDYGIDALIEIKFDNKVTGKLIAAQIKGSEGNFIEVAERPNHFVYYGKLKHYYYWIGHSLTVILILHNVNDGETYWVQVSRENVIGTEKAWKIYVPQSQKLDKNSIYNLSLLSRSELEQKIQPLYRYREVIAFLNNENYHVKAILHDEAKGAHLKGVFININVYHKDNSEVYEDSVWIDFPQPLTSHSQNIPDDYILKGLRSALNDWAIVSMDKEINISLNDLGKAFLSVIKYARPQLTYLVDNPHIETRPNF